MLLVLSMAGAAAYLAGCGTTKAIPGTVSVVAAENFWGSIAQQLAGDRATVSSIISNPNTDPHDYEPTTADAIAISDASLVIENGIGYDPWVDRLLAASSKPARRVLNVGQVVGVKPGGNPHQWYSPAAVHTVIAEMTSALQRLDPQDAAYFAQRRSDYETNSLAAYDGLVAEINTKYAGVPVGASESLVTPLAQALGLRVLTPDSFLTAISEGSEPTAQDKTVIDQQIKTGRIKVYIYNSQNATPDIQRQVDEAKAADIPVVTITETLEPATASFQEWQVAQLTRIQSALALSEGR